MFCEKCGIQMKDESNFCPSCGAMIKDNRVDELVSASVSPLPPPPPPIQTNNQYSGSHIPGYGQENRINSIDKPMSVGQYIGMLLLLVIPIVNLILLLVWSFGAGVNTNRKNYARAMLILFAVGIVFYLLVGISVFNSLKNMYY